MITRPIWYFLLAPVLAVPLALVSVRNYPEIAEGRFPVGAVIPWALVAAFYLSFGFWMFARRQTFRKEVRLIAAHLQEIGHGGVLVGRARTQSDDDERGARERVSTWVVLPKDESQTLFVDVVPATGEVALRPLRVPIRSIELAPSSFGNGAPPALEVSFADESSSHVELEGAYGSLFRPSIRAVEDALS